MLYINVDKNKEIFAMLLTALQTIDGLIIISYTPFLMFRSGEA